MKTIIVIITVISASLLHLSRCSIGKVPKVGSDIHIKEEESSSLASSDLFIKDPRRKPFVTMKQEFLAALDDESCAFIKEGRPESQEAPKRNIAGAAEQVENAPIEFKEMQAKQTGQLISKSQINPSKIPKMVVLKSNMK